MSPCRERHSEESPSGLALRQQVKKWTCSGDELKSDGLREDQSDTQPHTRGYRGYQMNTSLLFDNSHLNEPLLLPVKPPARSTKRQPQYD